MKAIYARRPLFWIAPLVLGLCLIGASPLNDSRFSVYAASMYQDPKPNFSTIKIGSSSNSSEVDSSLQNEGADNVNLYLPLTGLEQSEVEGRGFPDNTWVQFVILEVACIDETDPEFGSDHISLGGIFTSKFGVDKIPNEDLGLFEEGESISYTDWIFAELPITDIADYARISLFLVEIDGGGRDSALTTIAQNEADLTRDNMLAEALRLIEEPSDEQSISAANAHTQNSAFAPFLSSALRVGARVSIITILGSLWDSIVGIWEDDAFTLQYIDIPVPQQNESGRVIFEEHGGEYAIEYEWRWVEKANAAAIDVSNAPTIEYTPDYSFSDTVELISQLWTAATTPNLIFLPLATK
ncbi:MAG: hypothetical protein AAF702_49035 [Chloroflexota bacterium]